MPAPGFRDRMLRNTRMPARIADDSGLRAPPPPPELAGAGFSVTLTDALSENPLVAELQVIPKVNAMDGVSGATGSVTVWLPLVALVPAQLSSAPPPVAIQLVALADFQVSVVDCPALMVAGDAEIDVVTGAMPRQPRWTHSSLRLRARCS
jgi:hypothetical protein